MCFPAFMNKNGTESFNICQQLITPNVNKVICSFVLRAISSRNYVEYGTNRFFSRKLLSFFHCIFYDSFICATNRKSLPLFSYTAVLLSLKFHRWKKSTLVFLPYRYQNEVPFRSSYPSRSSPFCFVPKTLWWWTPATQVNQ